MILALILTAALAAPPLDLVAVDGHHGLPTACGPAAAILILEPIDGSCYPECTPVVEADSAPASLAFGRYCVADRPLSLPTEARVAAIGYRILGVGLRMRYRGPDGRKAADSAWFWRDELTDEVGVVLDPEALFADGFESGTLPWAVVVGDTP